MERHFLVLSILLFCNQAFAWDHPQYFYQPQGDESALVGRLQYATFDISGPGFDQTNTATVLEGEFFYGLTDQLGLLVQLGHTKTTVKSGSTNYGYSGLRDVVIGLIGNNGLENTILRYGLDLSIGGNSEVNGNNRKTNQFDGGLEVSPYIGLTHKIGQAYVGGKLQVEVLIGDRVTRSPTGDNKSTGGTQTLFSIFYEHQLEASQLGVEFDYIAISDDDANGGGSLENPTFFGPVFYGVFQVGERMTLIPEMSYYIVKEDEINGTQIDDTSLLAFEFAARLTF